MTKCAMSKRGRRAEMKLRLMKRAQARLLEKRAGEDEFGA
jgi:hypothetical protein